MNQSTNYSFNLPEAESDNVDIDVINENFEEIDTLLSEAEAHAESTENPHGVTKAQVGLGNADNTADADKNVLSATKLTNARNINGVSFDGSANITIMDDTKIPTAQKGAAGGVAELDSTGKVPLGRIPEGVGVLPRIEIRTIPGVSITVSNGTKTFTLTNNNGIASVEVPSFGNWTITAGEYNRVLTLDTIKIYKISVPALSEATWEQIAEISESGNAATVWSVGDEKDIDIGIETLTLQIYGFNHDNLTSGGKAGITFGMKNLMGEERQMNETGNNFNGFSGSVLYGYLQNTIFPAFHEELRGLIKPVNKKTWGGYSSKFIKTESMKLFLFSAIEVGLENPEASNKDEGETYPIFTNKNSLIKRRINGAGSADKWWTRSPERAINQGFYAVPLYGNRNNATSVSSNDLHVGVCFGFCI